MLRGLMLRAYVLLIAMLSVVCASVPDSSAVVQIPRVMFASASVSCKFASVSCKFVSSCVQAHPPCEAACFANAVRCVSGELPCRFAFVTFLRAILPCRCSMCANAKIEFTSEHYQ